MRSLLKKSAVIILLLSVGVAQAEIKSATANADFSPKPMPSPKKPAEGELPTVEVEGVKFFQRFSRDETEGKTQLGTGGHLVNSGDTERSLRVCIAFLDGDDNLIYVELLDKSLQAGASDVVMPLKNVPADLINKIKKYRITMYTAAESFR